MTGSLIISVTYGFDNMGPDDPVIKIAEEALDGLNHALNPGTFLVVRILPRFSSFISLACIPFFFSNITGHPTCPQVRSGLVPWCWVQNQSKGMEEAI